MLDNISENKSSLLSILSFLSLSEKKPIKITVIVFNDPP
jgi:hypothetical protein